jgi:hypothetical protein
MAILTSRIQASGVTLDDLIHIVITSDQSQNPAGSSYKATIGQVFDSLSSYTFTNLSVNGNLNVSGNTILNNVITNTLSATTYLGLPGDIFITGGTFDKNTETLTLDSSSGSPITITGFSDTYVTGFTYDDANTITLSLNNGQSSGVTLNTFTGLTINGGLSTTSISADTYYNLPSFTGNTSGDCITDLYVSNVNSCSPLHIQNNSLDNVLIGENGGVNVGIGTSSPSSKLHIKDSSNDVGVRQIIESEHFDANLTLNTFSNSGYTSGGSSISFKTAGNELLSIGTNTANSYSTIESKNGYNLVLANAQATGMFMNFYNTGPAIHLQTSNNSSNLMILSSTGDLGIGSSFNTYSLPSARLHSKGVDSSSSNYGLKVQDSGGTDNLVVRNDGLITVNDVTNGSDSSNTVRFYQTIPTTGTYNYGFYSSGAPNVANFGAVGNTSRTHFYSSESQKTAYEADMAATVSSPFRVGFNASIVGTNTGGTNVALYSDVRNGVSNYTIYSVNGDSFFNKTSMLLNGKTNGTDPILSLNNLTGTTLFYVRNDGNVGVGTSTPNAKLHINNITTGNTILFEDDTSPDPSPFVIDNGGKVGVGTTTPSEKLEVNNGNIKTNQGVIVNGGTFYGLRFNDSGFSRFAIDNSYKLNAAFTEGFKFTNGVYDFFNYDQSGNGDTFQIGNGLIKGRTTGITDVYLGINVSGTPSSTLEVNGKTKTTNLQVTSGASTAGYVLTDSDGTGNVTWSPVSGLTGSVKKYSETLTSPSGGTYTITHSLGTTDIQVSLWLVTTGDLTNARVTNRQTNSVDVVFSTSPGENVRVVIIG